MPGWSSNRKSVLKQVKQGTVLERGSRTDYSPSTVYKQFVCICQYKTVFSVLEQFFCFVPACSCAHSEVNAMHQPIRCTWWVGPLGRFLNPNNLYKYAGSHPGTITACMQQSFACAFERRSVHEKINLHAPEIRIKTIERDPNMIVTYIWTS